MSLEVLQVKTIDGPTARFSITGAEALIGRGAGNDLVLSDQTVSRSHARLRLRDDALTIEDLGSRAGTHVNDERISEAVALALGDRIRLGLTEMVVSGVPVAEPGLPDQTGPPAPAAAPDADYVEYLPGGVPKPIASDSARPAPAHAPPNAPEEPDPVAKPDQGFRTFRRVRRGPGKADPSDDSGADGA